MYSLHILTHFYRRGLASLSCVVWIPLLKTRHLFVRLSYRYIAVHQTYMGQLLKAKTSELDGPEDSSDDEDHKELRPAEECIRACVDMDFAENYEIVHKVEIQSEHWSHQQVTLYIVITHFKSNGVWKSEAHIFVSADRAHDTYFTQRAIAGDCCVRGVHLVQHVCNIICIFICAHFMCQPSRSTSSSEASHQTRGTLTPTAPLRTSRTSLPCSPCSNSSLQVAQPPFCGKLARQGTARVPGMVLVP